MGNSTSLDNNPSDSQSDAQSDTLDAFSDIDLAGLPLNDANIDFDLSNDIPEDVIYSNNNRLSPEDETHADVVVEHSINHRKEILIDEPTNTPTTSIPFALMNVLHEKLYNYKATCRLNVDVYSHRTGYFDQLVPQSEFDILSVLESKSLNRFDRYYLPTSYINDQEQIDLHPFSLNESNDSNKSPLPIAKKRMITYLRLQCAKGGSMIVSAGKNGQQEIVLRCNRHRPYHTNRNNPSKRSFTNDDSIYPENVRTDTLYNERRSRREDGQKLPKRSESIRPTTKEEVCKFRLPLYADSNLYTHTNLHTNIRIYILILVYTATS